jgi:DNA-binding IclR family transcriptional regulator
VSSTSPLRKTGISISVGEMFPESAAISAPVYGADDIVAAAIAVGAAPGAFESQPRQNRKRAAAAVVAE